MVEEDAMIMLSVQETSSYCGDVQTPFSTQESPSISLNKTQDENVWKTENLSIMDETMSQNPPCRPRVYTDLNTVVISGKCQGSDDDLDNDTVGGRVDNSANKGSRDDTFSAEGIEHGSENNCEHGMGVSSSQRLENHNDMVDKTLDTSSSLDIGSKNGAPFCSQLQTQPTIDSQWCEDIIKRQDLLGGSENDDAENIENAYTGSDDSSENCPLVNQNTVDVGLDDDAKGHTGDNTISVEATVADTGNNHQLDMDVSLRCELQDEKGSEPSKTDQEQNEIDEIKDKKVPCEFQDENGAGPPKTKQEEQTETKDNNTSCKSQDVKELESCKTKQEQNEIDETKAKNLSCEFQHNANSGNNTFSVEVKVADTRNNHELDSRKYISFELHNQKGAGLPKTYQEQNEIKDKKCPCELQDGKGAGSPKTKQEEQIEMNETKDNKTSCKSRNAKKLESCKTKQEQNQKGETKHKNISCEFQDEKGPRPTKINKTQEPDNSTSVGNQSCSSSQWKGSKPPNIESATRQSHPQYDNDTVRQKLRKSNKKMHQPRRGEKAFNGHHPKNRSPKRYTPKDDDSTFKGNKCNERKNITTIQSTESVRPPKSYLGRAQMFAAVVKLLPFIIWLFYMILPVHTSEIPASNNLQHNFCKEGVDLTNQILVLKKDPTSEQNCTFKASAVPYNLHCSEIEAWVLLENETCLEIYTKDLHTPEWILECGTRFNGDTLKSVCGGLFSDEEVSAKVRNNTQSTTTNAPPSTTGAPNTALDQPPWLPLIIFLALVLIACLILGLFFCYRKRCVGNGQPPALNDIELQANSGNGQDTSASLLSNGTSEH